MALRFNDNSSYYGLSLIKHSHRAFSQPGHTAGLFPPLPDLCHWLHWCVTSRNEHLSSFEIIFKLNSNAPTQQMQPAKRMWVWADRTLQPPWASHPLGLVMKFRVPKGGLASHSVAMVIKHMVLQTVRPKRAVFNFYAWFSLNNQHYICIACTGFRIHCKMTSKDWLLIQYILLFCLYIISGM